MKPTPSKCQVTAARKYLRMSPDEDRMLPGNELMFPDDDDRMTPDDDRMPPDSERMHPDDEDRMTPDDERTSPDDE